ASLVGRLVHRPERQLPGDRPTEGLIVSGRGIRVIRLSRAQVLAHRRRVGALDERLPMSWDSLRAAGWIGLHDSMPRAALLAVHARVAGATPQSWEDPAFVQLWGPRFQAYVVPAVDHALFSVSRYPDDAKGQRWAEKMASMLHEHLAGRRMRYDDAGVAL